MASFNLGDTVTVPAACNGTHVGETATVTGKLAGKWIVRFTNYSETFKASQLRHFTEQD